MESCLIKILRNIGKSKTKKNIMNWKRQIRNAWNIYRLNFINFVQLNRHGLKEKNEFKKFQ